MNTPADQVIWLRQQVRQTPKEKLDIFTNTSNDVRQKVRAELLQTLGLKSITDIIAKKFMADETNFSVQHTMAWAEVAITYQKRLKRDLVIESVRPFQDQLGIDMTELLSNLVCKGERVLNRSVPAEEERT